jgi:hypothetical protein
MTSKTSTATSLSTGAGIASGPPERRDFTHALELAVKLKNRAFGRDFFERKEEGS